MAAMVDNDLERTPSKKKSSNSGLVGVASNRSHSSVEADGETPYSAFRSAYTAPPYPRPQADRDHQQESITLDRERGDLTAHNLELIPNADQVAPGIRLDRGGNDFLFHDRPRNELASVKTVNQGEDGGEASQRVEGVEGVGEIPPRDVADKASIQSGKTPSSIDATGRSSNGAVDMEDGDDDLESDKHELFEDVDEGDEDIFDEKHVGLVHERVGGSGATSENASKGASVGHFGPKGEAIPGVPPHLDPRQPHFKPPSPSAASVVSVAVHPPASPKVHGLSGLGSGIGGSSRRSSTVGNPDITDSGEETERFENGAMTPTLSDDLDGDEELEKDGLHQSGFDASSPTPSPSLAHDGVDPFNFGRMNLGTSPQVSFSPNVMSYQADSFGGVSRTGRAPSIAATAGSSRAPSTRGVSPPASISRGTTTTTEGGSSMGEFDSMGTGIGESGVETPSIARSRGSSYSAPSSEVEQTGGYVGMEGVETNTRSRGATLTAIVGAMPGSSTNLVDETDDNLRDGPSLAPSEAGSDSTRSMNHDSVSHDQDYAYPSSGGIAVEGHGSSDRVLQSPTSAFAGTSSPGTFEPPSPLDYSSSTKDSLHPMLPSLLAIKKASRRNGSGAASTAATAGTASPASSLSVDGDYEDMAAQSQVVD